MKKRIFPLLSFLLLFGGCVFSPPTPPETLGDIAYDVDKRHGYTVYITENDEPTPYLVLTDDYNGNVLLLRERLLDEAVKYNDYGEGYAALTEEGYQLGYYNHSIVDKYLNETFLPWIDAELQDSIVDSEITITAEESLGNHGKYVEQITRKSFLLSYTELGYEENIIHRIEGKSLKYFEDDSDRLIAYNSKEAWPWWLRTPVTSLFNSSYGIDQKGRCGGGQIETAGFARRFAFQEIYKLSSKR
ncbi:MAG: DUF6273 domain-containing protein [Oscillospiraceae bacterium]|jgi:hypothetical protein|nr:DUF6273 domain-containing protein [Oscillospiraceae bacterium]